MTSVFCLHVFYAFLLYATIENNYLETLDILRKACYNIRNGRSALRFPPPLLCRGENMNVIENKRFGCERDLYGSRGLIVKNCRFEGPEDGESALKESRDIIAENCYMDLRYPFWHIDGVKISGGEMTKNCRAALWYDRGVEIEDCKMNGIKALRECSDIFLNEVEADSPEFGWKCRGIRISGGSISSEYAFLESENIRADKMKFAGKYSFQYTKNVNIANSELNTKDAFWHAKNVTVTDSVLNGEYLAWYSDRLTLIRCHIKGTQPFCYCRRLTLIDCTMEDCDLAFEYSDVKADIRSEVLSVKNPHKGRIVADKIGEIILTDNSVYPVKAKIEERNK